MQKFLRTMLLMACLIVPWATNAQETLTVNDGTATNGKIPVNGLYTDTQGTTSEFVIPATTEGMEDLVGATITKLTFYVPSPPASWGTPTIQLYMGEVDYTTLSSLNGPTNFTVVATGVWDNTQTTIEVEFDEPYIYEGGNLLIGTYVQTASSYKTTNFAGVTAESGASRYNNGSGSGTTQTFLPKVTFTYEPGGNQGPTCTKPNALTVANILHNEATMSWNERGEATTWQLCINDDEDNIIDVTSTTYTLTELTPLTTYTVKVRAYCSDDLQSDWTSNVSFTTSAVAEVVGDAWSDDFEADACGWEFINGTLTNTWAWGTAINNGGTHALYISNDGGTTNAYTVSGSTVVYATKLLTFADGKYEFSYDWNGNGESTWDFMRVALVPSSTTLTAGTSLPSGLSATAVPTGWIALDGGSKLNLTTAWQSNSVAVNITAGNYYLVLAWRNDNSSGTNPPAAIDNVSITRLACAFDVADLTANNITASSSTITWTAGDAEQWQVVYSDNSNFENATEELVNAATYAIDGLQGNTSYYVKVRAYCGGEDFGSWSTVYQFRTACEAISELPWTEDFETVPSGSYQMPYCWTKNNGGVGNYPYDYSSSSYAHGGTRSLYFYTYSSSSYADEEIAVMPELGTDFDLSTLRLRFYAKSSNATIVVGTMSDPEDATTFTEVETYTVTGNAYGDPIACTNFPATTDRYIAFKVTKAESSSITLYIDDITIDYIPSCPDVAELAAGDITADGATLTWADNGAGEFVVLDAEDNVVATVSGTTYIITGLDPQTDYTYGVASNCSGDMGSIAPVTFRTACVAYEITVENPLTEGFEGSEMPPACWSMAHTAGSNTSNLWNRNTSTKHEGAAGAQLPDQSTGNKTNLVSPLLNIPEANRYQVSFWINRTTSYATKTIEGVKVWVNTTPDTIGGTPLMHIRRSTSQGEITEAAAGWYQYTELIPTSGNVYIIFEGISEYGASTFIDDITIDAAPTCLPVTELAVSEVTAESVTLTWADSRNEGASYLVTYGDNNIPVQDNNTTITGLSAESTYTFNVMAVCGIGDSSTIASVEGTTLASCAPAANLAVSDITANGATLTWNSNAETYTIYNMADETVLGTTTDLTFTLTDLAGNTQYTIGVKATCGEIETAVTTVSFKTLCGTETMPWTENFDEWAAKSDCWSFLSGAYNMAGGTPTASTSAWALNTSYGDYITLSGKALTMNIYSNYRYWAVTPAVNITADAALLSVDVAVAAWSSATPNFDGNDTLAFAISTDGGATFTNLQVLDNTELNALTGEYTTIMVPVTGYNGQAVRFAIFGGSSASGGDNRLVIDNVTVGELPETVYDTVYETACDSYTWNGETYTESGVYSYASNPISVSVLVLTVNNAVATTMEVTAENSYDWNGETYTISGVYTYTTTNAMGCDSVVTLVLTIETSDTCSPVILPYSIGFEQIATGNLPSCWSQIAVGSSSSTFPSVYNYAPNAHSGDAYFEFESSSGETEIVALPVMNDINQLTFTFYAALINNNFALEAGVMESGEFIPVDTVNLQSSFGWNYLPYTVSFADYSGNGNRIALRTTATGNYTLMIDDIIVMADVAPEYDSTFYTESACDIYTWSVNGQTYTESGNYTFVDGIHTDILNLTIKASTSSEEEVTVSDSYEWNGQTYTESGIYTGTFTAANGCDSVVTLNLTVAEACPEGMVCIGAGEATNQYVPTYTFYNYSLTQQIYTADEIGQAGAITSIDFHSNSEKTRTVNVYMVETDKETFSGSSDWISVTESDLVFSGEVTFAADDWTTIEFDNPFVYNGTQNVAVIFDDNTGSYISAPNFRVFDATSQAIRVYSDGTNYDPYAPDAYNGTVLNVKNQIRLAIGDAPTCTKPSGVTASNVTAHEASITWGAANADDNSWLVNVNGTITAVSDTSYTVTGLDAETEYTVSVATYCGDGDTSKWRTVSFTTTIACPAPTNFAVTLTPGDGTVATFSWTPGGEETQWSICFDDNTDQAFIVNENPVTITGLTPEVALTAKVNAYCGNDEFSPWSNTITFTPTNVYSITVNDGTTTNNYVPIYGTWVDDITKSQFIIPAEELTAMQYGTVSKLTFYSSNANVSWGNAQFEVYMTETEATTLTALADYSDMENVMAAGSLSIIDGVMEVTLDAPFQYTNGNLMVGFLQTVSGSYVSSNWYGVSAESGASFGGYGSSINAQSFLPKVTLAYTPGEAPEFTCNRPATFEVSDITAHEATFAWDGDASEYALEYKIASEDEWTVVDVTDDTYTLTGLVQNTAYNARVKAVCAEYDMESSYRTANFTTLIACPAPTDVIVSDITGTSATISWTGEAENYSLMIGDNMIEVVGNTYTVTDLLPATNYAVSVKALCGDEGESSWTNTMLTTAEVCPEGLICIGAGEATNQYIPTYTYYNYSLTQQIYTADEIGQAGAITSIDFRGNSEKTRTVNVYMVETDKETFSGSSDWISVTESDLVFSGEVTFAADDWTTIELDNPFVYNGTQNVAVIFDDNTGSWEQSPAFRVFDATSQAIHVYSDGTNYDPYAPGANNGTVLNVKNQIRLAIGEPPACSKPGAITVESVTGTTANISWTAGGDETEWNVYLNNEIVSTVTTPAYAFSNLEGMTAYNVSVSAVCGDSESDMRNATFATECASTTCEISIATSAQYNYSSYQPTIDLYQNGVNIGSVQGDMQTLTACSTFPVVALYTAPTWSYSPTVTILDGGNTVVFEGSTDTYETGDQLASFVPCPTCLPVTELAYGEVTSESVTLTWADTRNEGATYLVTYGEGTLAVYDNTVVISGLEASTSYTFSVVANCSVGDTSSAATITVSTLANCSPAVDLTVSDITANSATLTWNGTATEYYIFNMADSTTIGTATGLTYTITGLETLTSYTFGVKGFCDSIDTEMTYVTFNTGCENGNCNITIVGHDSYGDGWNGNYIDLFQNGVMVDEFTLENGGKTEPVSETFSVCAGMPIDFLWKAGTYASETSFEILNANGDEVYSQSNGSDLSTGVVFYTMESCTAEPVAEEPAVMTLPYCDDFESYEHLHLPDGWTAINEGECTTHDFGRPRVYNNLGVDGSKELDFFATCLQVAVLPRIDSVDISDVRIQCMASSNSSESYVVVGVMTDPSDLSTFVEVDTLRSNVPDDWMLINASLAGYTGDGHYVAFYFHSDGTERGHIYVDNLCIGMESDTIWVDTTIVEPVVDTVTVTACDSYEWYGTTYTESGVYTYETAEHVYILNLTINHGETTEETVVSDEAYTWNGVTYVASGDYLHTYTDENNCESTVTLHLTIIGGSDTTITDTTVVVEDATITTGEIIYWVGEGPNEAIMAVNWADTALAWGYHWSGEATVGDMMNAIAEADPRFSYDGDYGLVNNIMFNDGTVNLTAASGDYWWINVNGSSDNAGLSQTIATYDFIKWGVNSVGVVIDSTYWEGYGWYASAMAFPMTIYPVSIPETDTTIVEPVYYTVNAYALDSTMGYVIGAGQYEDGTTATISAIAYSGYHFMYWSNAEINATFELTVNADMYLLAYFEADEDTTIVEPVVDTVTVTACDSYEWYGTTYTESGVYTYETAEHVYILNLTINHGETTEETVVSDEAYTWNGVTYVASGDYTYNYTGANGCESTAILHLTINEVNCDSITLPYTMNFDNLVTGALPACWMRYQVGGGLSDLQFPCAYQYGDNLYFEFESYYGETEMVALPVMPTNINELTLSFRAAANACCLPAAFEVGVYDEADSSFTSVETINFTLSSYDWNYYYDYNVNFSDYNGTGNRIAMRAVGSEGNRYTLMIDDLSVYINTDTVVRFDTIPLTMNGDGYMYWRNAALRIHGDTVLTNVGGVDLQIVSFDPVTAANYGVDGQYCQVESIMVDGQSIDLNGPSSDTYYSVSYYDYVALRGYKIYNLSVNGSHSVEVTYGSYYDSTKCTIMSALYTYNPFNTSAGVRWVHGNGTDSYHLSYGLRENFDSANVVFTGDHVDTVITTTDTVIDYLMTGLQPNSHYAAMVKMFCDNGEWWYTWVTFYTTGDPHSITVTNNGGGWFSETLMSGIDTTITWERYEGWTHGLTVASFTDEAAPIYGVSTSANKVESILFDGVNIPLVTDTNSNYILTVNNMMDEYGWTSYEMTVYYNADHTIEVVFGPWQNDTTIVEPTTATITVTYDATLGTVIGGGEYNIGDTATLIAVTYPNVTFAGWSNGGNNPMEIVVNEDMTITANFQSGEIATPDTVFVHDTTIVTLTDTVINTEYVYDTVEVEVPVEVLVHDTTFVTLTDTVTNTEYVYDTVEVEVPVEVLVHDTTFVTLTDTVTNTEYVYDTVEVEVPVEVLVHDTTFVEVPVHDTTYVDVFVHDTTIVTLTDTVTNTEYVYDTVTLTDTVVNTEYVEVPVHDTTYVDVFVHDTTYVDNYIHDTTFVTEYDSVDVTIYVHDTTVVEVPVEVTVYDTVVNTEYVEVPVHDTTIVTLTDTVTNTEYVYDTVEVEVPVEVLIHDTTLVEVPVHDTTYVDVFVHDTTIVTLTDTVTNTEYVYDTIILVDTVVNTEYVEVPVHDTTYITVVDTVVNTEYVEVPVHDTTYITVVDTVVNTEYVEVPVHDTTYITVVDTVVNTEYVEVPVHDTTYITVVDTVVNTEYVEVPVHDTTYITVVDTVVNTEYVEVPVHDTTIVTNTEYVNVYDTITMTDTVYSTRYIEVPVMVYADTLYLTDTAYVTDTVVNTEYVEVEVPVHDTTVVTNTEYIFDTVVNTEYVEVEVHDTTFVEVPVEVEVHDTTYVDNYIHDTTYVTEYDSVDVTVYVPVHDTTIIEVPVHDTTIVTLVDTVISTRYVEVPIHDTTIVEVEVPVHDTTFVTLYDTVVNTEYVEVPVHDTTYITLFDTIINTEYVEVEVHDTTIVTMYDTIVNTEYVVDTVINTEYVYDTVTNNVYVEIPVHDTTVVTEVQYIEVEVPVHDTTIVTVVDTVVNNVFVEVPVHDTTIVTQYDTVVNTVYVEVPVHDTTVVTNTEYIYDTVTSIHYVEVPVHDTTVVTMHDTVVSIRYIEVPVYDTTYITLTDTVVETEYVEVPVHDTTIVTLYDTVIETEYIEVEVHDTTVVTNVEYVYDTVVETEYVEVPVHDTTIVTLYDTVVNTEYVEVPVHDTTIVTQYDTIVNTVYDTVTNTEYVYDTITNTVYDTVTNTEFVYDTITNTVYDTIESYVYDTIEHYVHDTVNMTGYVIDFVTNYIDSIQDAGGYFDPVTLGLLMNYLDSYVDTIYADTLYVTDTVYIHDTIYVTVDGIADVQTMNIRLYQRNGNIVVEDADGGLLPEVRVYDAVGRQMEVGTANRQTSYQFRVPASGAYLVKVGDQPAKRVVVIR